MVSPREGEPSMICWNVRRVKKMVRASLEDFCFMEMPLDETGVR